MGLAVIVLCTIDISRREVVESGDEISVWTSDPSQYPLPSRALMDSRWHLHRIVAMSGVIEPNGLDADSDSETIACLGQIVIVSACLLV